MASKAFAILGVLGAAVGLAVASSTGSSKPATPGAKGKLPDIPPFVPPNPPAGQYVPPSIPPGIIPGITQPVNLPPVFIPAGYSPPPDPPVDYGPPPVPQGPIGRFADVHKGEGPYAFVTRVSGAKYAGKGANGWGWHGLEAANPNLVLNSAGDNYTDDSWFPGLSVRIPDAWPGGTPGTGTASGGLFGGGYS